MPNSYADEKSGNENCHELLRRGAELAVNDALAQMGDIGNTCHKQADSQVKINTAEEAAKCSPWGSELLVRVLMCVKRNCAGVKADHCPNKCGNCSVNCCQLKCNCKCPSKQSSDCARLLNNKCWKFAGLCLCLIGILIILGIATAFVRSCFSNSSNKVIKNRPCPEKIIVVRRLHDSKPATSSAKAPTVPVLPPPPTCPIGTIESPDPPSFLLPNLHNQVRRRVNKYIVTYLPDCQGATMAGWHQGRNGNLLVNLQEYGPNLSFKHQWIINYPQSGNYLWIDFFTAPNLFVGRTIYEYNQAGQLMRVRLFDGQQKPLLRMAVERDYNGNIMHITLERLNLFGVVFDTQELSSIDDQQATSEFYLYKQFVK